ncbi:gametocyte-specific factor 1 isoform X2 [Neoarius graeffei]|uniref:gametocyte-specific factor 1 isoform X2 n=1 Tax=Neoarius graeffei TaxID=443677 RepID=UPI00298CD55E|nr:gametocyte-specific factor 1 isoform X2 [Neoarius graeffei]
MIIPSLSAVNTKPVDDANPNALMQCPYDKNHQIRACRFPFHILKCAKNHSKLASELKTCPFNARHLVPRHELAHHIEHCENKCSFTVEDGVTKTHPKFHVPIKWTAPACEEDWEKEADDDAVPFVWGVTNNPFTVNKPEPPVMNNLNAGVRAPRTLPWKPAWFLISFTGNIPWVFLAVYSISAAAAELFLFVNF